MPSLCGNPVPVDPICQTASGVTQGIAGDFIQAAAKDFSDALSNMLVTVLTFWTSIGTPANLQDPAGPVAFLRESTSWLTAFILIISLIIAGARMAITQNFEAGQDAAKGLWQFALYSGAGVPAVFLLGVAGDQFSQWIINRGADGDLAGRINAVFTLTGLEPIGFGLVLIIALLGIFSALAQMFLMIVRAGMLVLLAGMLPMSAAAAVSKGGKAWFQKTLGWLLAFIAYKPAAAIIYATAFAMVSRGNDPPTILSGLFLITLSVLALPALLRLVVPVTASIAAGSSGSGAGAAAAGGALATGALQMRAASGHGSSPSPDQGSIAAGASGTPAGAGRPQPNTNSTGGAISGAQKGASSGAAGGAPGMVAGGIAGGIAGTAGAARRAAEDQASGPTGSQGTQQ